MNKHEINDFLLLLPPADKSIEMLFVQQAAKPIWFYPSFFYYQSSTKSAQISLKAIPTFGSDSKRMPFYSEIVLGFPEWVFFFIVQKHFFGFCFEFISQWKETKKMDKDYPILSIHQKWKK